MTPAVNTANRQIARAAGVVMIAFVLSNLTGLVRHILVLKTFGASAPLDAFYAANRIPDTIFNLIAAGALSSAFIPTFTGILATGDRRSAWQLASAIANLAALVLALFSLLAAIFAPQIVHLLFVLKPDLDPSLQALTTTLLHILLLTTVVFGMSGLLMGILNAHQSFWLPALSTTMYWLGWIIAILFFVPSLGITGLAWGAVLGSLLHLGIQLPGLFKLPERRYFPTLGLNLSAVREVARLMAPRLLGVGVVQLNFLVITILATGMSDGSLTAITTAWMVLTMPEAVIAQAIAIAALPTFSTQVARGLPQEMRQSLAATLRSVILLSVPASLGLILLARPLVALAFQHGKCEALCTNQIAWALVWYAAGLVGHCIVEVMSRAFYALHDTRTPVFIGAAAMSLNLAFSLIFSALFARLGWMPHGGLALSLSVSTALEAACLLVFMRRRLHGLEGHKVATGVLQAAGATLLMSLVVWGWLAWTNSRSNWLVVPGAVLLGGLVFAMSALGLGVPEAREVVRLILNRLQRVHSPLTSR